MVRSAGRCRGRNRGNVVIDMDSAEARKAAFAEAKAQSLEALARTADVRVEHRDHDDDALMRWRSGMPAKPPAPTADEIKQWIAEAVDQGDAATGNVLYEMGQQLRAEIQQLRADVTLSLAHASGDNTAEVIELPNPLRGRRA